MSKHFCPLCGRRTRRIRPEVERLQLRLPFELEPMPAELLADEINTANDLAHAFRAPRRRQDRVGLDKTAAERFVNEKQ